MPTTIPTILMPAQLADMLGVRVRYLADLRHSGRGPRYTRVGRKFRYRLADIESWLVQQSFGNTSEYSTSNETNHDR